MPARVKFDRRAFLKSAPAISLAFRSLAGGAIPKVAVPQTVGGLHFGVETFSFHDIPQGDLPINRGKNAIKFLSPVRHHSDGLHLVRHRFFCG